MQCKSRNQQRRRRFSSDSDIAATKRKKNMGSRDFHVGTSRDCYEKAGKTEEELKREIEDLKSKVNFLRLLSTGSGGPIAISRSNTVSFSDVVLIASDPTGSANPESGFPFVTAHRAVLTSRSPVFRAMLGNDTEESISGTIKVGDASYDALQAFVKYLYTVEACLDKDMACDLLVLAEKYQVTHLKTYCEKFLMSKLNWENSLPCYAFALQHSSKCLLDASLSLIMDNMDELSKREEYMEFVEKHPRVVVEIYEAYLSKSLGRATCLGPPPSGNTAASKTPNINREAW